MSEEVKTINERRWVLLYPEIVKTLGKFGVEDELGNEDFWVFGDYWGYPQHKIFFNRLHMLLPEVITSLQDLLDNDDWEFVVTISTRGEGENWPDMGLKIRRNQIIDGLQRQYFPPEYQSIQYEGSRVGTDKD
ncbi:MAG: hypothetical protein KF835_03440 [Xanthobacteraceae bacterium]|jgi:hypothetical protein|nr:hypothetical protein [Xanthobacteraceae bacterium]